MKTNILISVTLFALLVSAVIGLPNVNYQVRKVSGDTITLCSPTQFICTIKVGAELLNSELSPAYVGQWFVTDGKVLYTREPGYSQYKPLYIKVSPWSLGTTPYIP